MVVLHRTFFSAAVLDCWTQALFFSNYRNRALKSRGSYGNSALFRQRSKHISLDFYVLSSWLSLDKSAWEQGKINK